MFSDKITQSDSFLDMPKESQLLYFHLGVMADDDGFVASTKMIQRVLGVSDDSLKILFVKKFIIPFESGICVIKHWRINNQIRKDRYKQTKYIRERGSLFIRPNGAYTTNPEDAKLLPHGHFLVEEDDMATIRQPLGVVGKVSIGKVSIDKKEEIPENINSEAWVDWVAYRNEIKKKMTPTTVKMQFKLLGKYGKFDQKAIIDKSISNGWTGLFDLKNNAGKTILKPSSDKYKNL